MHKEPNSFSFVFAMKNAIEHWAWATFASIDGYSAKESTSQKDLSGMRLTVLKSDVTEAILGLLNSERLT